MVAVPFVDFVHPDDVAVTNQQAAQLSQGHITVGLENRYRCSDGSYRWLSWKATGDAERGRIYAAARDVTLQKQWQQDQRQRLTELAALNDELEAFSYSVSHDLRAPLRHIIGFAALLEQRVSGQLDEQSRRYVTTMKEAATRMGRLIDDLLAFSRMGRAPLTTRPVDLQSLIDDVKRELESELKGRHVHWRIEKLPQVFADPSLLRVADQSDRERAQIHEHAVSGTHRNWCERTWDGRDRSVRSRQWCRFRHEIRREVVWRLSTTAWRRSIRRHRHWSGHRSPDCSPSRWLRLGRSGSRSRCDVLSVPLSHCTYANPS